MANNPDPPDPATPETLAALLAHARALVGAELGEIADGLGLPVPHGQCAPRDGRGRSWSASSASRRAACAGPTSRRWASSSRPCRSTPTSRRASRRRSARSIRSRSPPTRGRRSYVREKLARVLFVALEVPPDDDSVGERRVAAVRLWSPDAERGARAARRLRAVRARLSSGAGAPTTSPATWAPVLQVRPKGKNAARHARRLRRRRQPDARRASAASTCARAFVAAILQRSGLERQSVLHDPRLVLGIGDERDRARARSRTRSARPRRAAARSPMLM